MYSISAARSSGESSTAPAASSLIENLYDRNVSTPVFVWASHVENLKFDTSNRSGSSPASLSVSAGSYSSPASSGFEVAWPPSPSNSTPARQSFGGLGLAP